MRSFDKRAGNDRTVLEHILQIYKVTVMHMLGKIVRIVEMDDTFIMGIYDFLGKQYAIGNIPGNLTCHIITLGRVYDGVFIGIFLFDFLIITFDKRKNFIVGRIAFTDQGTDIAICNIVFGNFESAVRHDLLFHQILNFFNGGGAVKGLAGDNDGFGNPLDLQFRHSIGFVNRIISLGNRNTDLIDVEVFFGTVSFNNSHVFTTLPIIFIQSQYLVFDSAKYIHYIAQIVYCQ